MENNVGNYIGPLALESNNSSSNSIMVRKSWDGENMRESQMNLNEKKNVRKEKKMNPEMVKRWANQNRMNRPSDDLSSSQNQNRGDISIQRRSSANVKINPNISLGRNSLRTVNNNRREVFDSITK